MIDLCTVANTKFIKNAIKLAQSYINNKYTGKIFLYYFDISSSDINHYKSSFPDINFIEIPKFCNHAYSPRIFAYKSFSMFDCITEHSNGFIYSDSTNLINKYIDINQYFIDSRLFLPYNHKLLSNKYWTTKLCFQKIENTNAEESCQYWAGLQGYIKTDTNIQILKDQYNYMLDPDIAFPDPSIKYPDGHDQPCIEHRQDQSVLSILIDKYQIHQAFDEEKQNIFGDSQTYQLFDNSYIHNVENSCILSRYTKNNL